MVKSPNPLGSPQSLPITPTEVDSLYGVEISGDQKTLKDLENKVRAIKSNLRDLRIKDNEAKGIEPAFVTDEDLIVIIGVILLTDCPVSTAFSKREQGSSQCKDWAKRAIRSWPDEMSILNALAGIGSLANDVLELMKEYEQFDIKEIVTTKSYRQALNKMRKQLKITQLLKQKDDEISSLSAQLKIAIDAGSDWRANAVNLKKIGLTHTEIAPIVRKGRNTVSTYLNSPGVKPQRTK